MSVGSVLGDGVHTLISPWFALNGQRSLLSYLGAAIFAFLIALAVRCRRPRAEFRLRAFFRLLARKSVWRHRSAILDYKLYLLNMPLMAFALCYLVVGSGYWTHAFDALLTRWLGAHVSAGHAGWTAIGGIAIVQVLALDLGYWLGHAAMHRSEILWQFHKVHHSAEVMTPATEYRQHPVELVLIPSIIAPVMGLSLALATRWFGTDATAAGVQVFNLVALAHVVTFHHLRHSHIAMPFTGVMGVLFHSPAHHQLHHSSDPAHFNCNMGYALSVWDWLAGTLRMPQRGLRPTLGVGTERADHTTVAGAMWSPFRDAGAVIGRKLMTKTSTPDPPPTEPAITAR